MQWAGFPRTWIWCGASPWAYPRFLFWRWLSPGFISYTAIGICDIAHCRCCWRHRCWSALEGLLELGRKIECFWLDAAVLAG
jgi:hypothetical protein